VRANARDGNALLIIYDVQRVVFHFDAGGDASLAFIKAVEIAGRFVAAALVFVAWYTWFAAIQFLGQGYPGFSNRTIRREQ
jgi:hypothetical protein